MLYLLLEIEHRMKNTEIVNVSLNLLGCFHKENCFESSEVRTISSFSG